MRIFSLLGFCFSFGNSRTSLLTGSSRLNFFYIRHLHAPALKLEVPNSAWILNTSRWILGIGSNRNVCIFCITPYFRADITPPMKGVKRHMSEDMPSTKCDYTVVYSFCNYLYTSHRMWPQGADMPDLDSETDETKFDVIRDLEVVVLADQLLKLLGKTNVLWKQPPTKYTNYRTLTDRCSDNPLTPTESVAIWVAYSYKASCVRVPGCRKNYKWRLNPVWHRMLYSCTHMATVGVKGLNNLYWTSGLPL